MGMNKQRIAIQTTEESLYAIHQRILNLLKNESQATRDLIKQVIDYYEMIILCMPGNVYWMDKNCTTIGCNQNVLDMFKLQSREEFYNLSFEEMTHIGNWSKDQGASFKRDTLEVITTGMAKQNVEEPPIPGADGKDIYFLSTRMPIFNIKGEILGIVGISTDISQQKRSEIALIQAKKEAETANQLKTEFIRNMEHDIRTPFSGIYGIVSILANQETDPEKKETLTQVATSAKELLDYCNRILEFSRIEANAFPVQQQSFNLKKLIDGVIDMEIPTVKLKGLSLTSEYDVNLPEIIMSDYYRIQSILINLISNAIKFTKKGYVKLTVALSKPKDEKRYVVIRFIVEDSGMGIPKEKQQIVYERFTRIIPSNQGNYKGQGLGLKIVKQFINELDGDIHLYSSENKGTKFMIEIPAKIPLTNDIVDDSL